MRRAPHPKKEVDQALRHAEKKGWRVEIGGAHAWGKIYCPYNDEECRCGEFCITSVWSTPKNPEPVEYTFTLKYQLSEQGADLDELVERLGASGCDDALAGIGQPGRIALEFIREAVSAKAALTSALADVKRALPAAKLIEAAPDLVGLTDVADVVGVTRQNMRKLMVGHPTSFPTPVHEGNASVWHLSEIMSWLQERGTYKVEASVLEVAVAAMQVNLAKEVEFRQVSSKVHKELRALFA